MTKSAYEKMLEDGTAFKKVDMSQPTPDNPEGNAFGSHEQNSREHHNGLFEQHMDRDMDDVIEQAKRLKQQKTGKPVQSIQESNRSAPIIQQTDNKKMKELERRISILEQALQLVMETQTKLLKED